MQITEQIIERIARRTFNSMFAPSLRQSNVVTSGPGSSVSWADNAGHANSADSLTDLSQIENMLADYVSDTELETTLASYATKTWVDQNYLSLSFFNALFQARTSQGAAVAPNSGDTTTIDNIKAMFGFWTDQYISALGQGADGGGPVTTLAQLNDVSLSLPLADGEVLTYSSALGKWTNGAGVSVAWNDITGKPTTLAGYGITDAHITNGVITLGSNSITPITSLTGYATESWVNTQLGSYVTTTALGTTLADYVTTSALTTTLADYGSKTWVESSYISKAFFNRLFRAFAPVAEGESEAAQVEPNDVTTEIDNIKAMFGLWTEQYLSALGLGSDAGHSIGVLDDLNDVTITNPQTNQVLTYINGEWVNAAAPSGASALSGLTDVAISSLADKDLLQWDYATGKWKNVVLSTVMSGYALASSIPTNVSQLTNDSGYITSAALSGYATQAWVGQQGYITGITSSMVTSALGYTPANSTALSDYLPLSGGTLTGTLQIIKSAPNTTRGMIFLENINNNEYSQGIHLQFDATNTTAHQTAFVFGNTLAINNSACLNWGYRGNESNSNFIGLGFYGNDNILNILGSKRVGINTTTPSYTLDVNGQIRSTGNIYSDSQLFLGSYSNITKGSLISSLLTANDIAIYACDGSSLTNISCFCANFESSGTIKGTAIYYNGNACIHAGNIGSQSVNYANSAGSVAWTNVSGRPTALSSFTNDTGYATTTWVGQNYLPLSGGTISSTSGAPLSINSTSVNSIIYFCVNDVAKVSAGYSANFAYIANENTLARIGIADNGTPQYWSAYDSSTAKTLYHQGNCNNTSTAWTGSTVTAAGAMYVGYGGTSGYGAYAEGIRLYGSTTSNSFITVVFGCAIGQTTGTHTDQWQIGRDSSNRYFINHGGQVIYTIDTSNNFGIGTQSPSYKLHVAGDIYANGGVTALSDIRKKDVTAYELPLSVEQIAAAPTIKFLWKDKREEGEQVGTIAQYWQNVLPWVIKDKSGELSMQYGVAALISSITIARKVVNHEERIKALERENADLKQAYSFIKNAYDYLKMDYEQLKLKIA